MVNAIIYKVDISIINKTRLHGYFTLQFQKCRIIYLSIYQYVMPIKLEPRQGTHTHTHAHIHVHIMNYEIIE